MFYLIMFVVGVLLFFWGFYLENKGSDWDFMVQIWGILFSAIFGITSLILLIGGISDYPIRIGEQEEIKVYRQRIIDIRRATYKVNNKATLISGNIENFKQSTALSDYIKSLSKLEANYNKELVSSKLYKNESVLWFFTQGMFISDKINDLKRIEIENYEW